MSNPVLPSLLSAQLNSDVTQCFPGLQERCREFSKQGLDFTDTVMDDMDGEQETMPIRTESDAVDGDVEGERFLDDEGTEQDITMADTTPSSKSNLSNLTDMDSTGLRNVLKEASKGVGEGTHAEYQRLMIQCEDFLVKRKLIQKRGDLFAKKPPRDAAEMLVAWIMESCNSMKLDGTKKDPSEVQNGYTHAQKMRAAATFGFGRTLGKGRTPWGVSTTGEMVGNPSVSEMVSCYMVSLRRRKVKSGEEPTSSRAITPELIGKLWNVNRLPENWEIKKYSPGHRGEKQSNDWGGPCFRRALNLAYTLAYVCLLRVDEVLKIQSHDIELVDEETL